MAGNFILVEPLFYGTLDKGLSGEDFVDRITALYAAQAWPADEAVGKASSFLRGPAREWFTRGLALQLQDRAAATLFKTDWTTFVSRFKEMYVQVHVLADVGASWGSLRQSGKENVREFTQRVASTLAAYGSLCSPTPMLVATITAAHDKSAAANTDVLRLDALANWTTLLANRDLDTVDKLVGSFAVKVIADGLASEKLRTLVRKLEREETAFYDIVRALLNAQLDLGARQLPAAAAVSAAGRSQPDARRQNRRGSNRTPSGSSSGGSSSSSSRPRDQERRQGSDRRGPRRDAADAGGRAHRPSGCGFCASQLHAREDCPMMLKASASASADTAAAAAGSRHAAAATNAAASDVSASTASMFEMMDVGDLWIPQGNA